MNRPADDSRGRPYPCVSGHRIGGGTTLLLRALQLCWSQGAGVFAGERLGDDSLIGALNFGDFRGVNFFGDADFFKRPDYVPVEINFVPGEAVARGDGMRVVIVVPAFAPGYQRDPPAIGG